jgi:hypothetical protein
VSTVTAPPPSILRPLLSPEKRDAKKVCLVGFCQGHRDLAPYTNPEFVVMGLNKGYVFQPAFDVWFETHSKQIYTWEIRRPHKHVEWMKSIAPRPVFMHVADPEIPNSYALPLRELAEDVGLNLWRLFPTRPEQFKDNDPHYRQDGAYWLESQALQPYLTSSIAYQLAFAIYERFEEIHLYGIDLNTGGEYAWQKAGVEYLIGLAAGRGIRVVIPDNCALLKGKLYGRGFLKPEGEAVSKSQYEVRLAEVRKRRLEITARYHQVSGAKAELEFIAANMPPGLPHEKLIDRLKQMGQEHATAEGQLRQLEGSETELLYWISMTPEGIDARQAIEQLNGQATPAEAQAAGVAA